MFQKADKMLFKLFSSTQQLFSLENAFYSSSLFSVSQATHLFPSQTTMCCDTTNACTSNSDVCFLGTCLLILAYSSYENQYMTSLKVKRFKMRSKQRPGYLHKAHLETTESRVEIVSVWV